MTPPFVRKTTWILVLVAFGAACKSWQAADPGELQVTPRDHPPNVRVTRVDGGQLELDRAELRGDSVVGFVSGFISCDARIAVPLAEVETMEAWRMNTGSVLAPLWLLLGALLTEDRSGTFDSYDLPGALRGMSTR